MRTTKNRDPQGFISACESRSLFYEHMFKKAEEIQVRKTLKALDQL
ncbi:hypothetical protein HMPREF0539_1209 [Lacticaseibacillus rhamnosus LMS2-1]|uniref:Uncharacterized protein n=1 Tax=Lacticaseibacillus rhamnosus (strain LMS2-1) TaxID=525361 RepID=C2JWC5_LACRM|nr:conserved hypothetical protein [Lacticaseibacillus rhamnosus ATCC 8530]EEN80661.1 hypothetical protein HMPREF0539_1209 [Lacticaseibacillus rhamnosus LMS2-1]